MNITQQPEGQKNSQVEVLELGQNNSHHFLLILSPSISAFLQYGE